MKRIDCLLFLLFLFVSNNLFAAKYSEDNAAYWYKKAFSDVLLPLTQLDEYNDKIISLSSLEDFNKLKPESKAKIKEVSNEFFNNLKKAKSIKKCFFWKNGTSNEDSVVFEDINMVLHGFKIANAIAWYAISINKTNIAGAIWQTMLSIASNITEHNSIYARSMIGCVTLRIVLKNLDNFLKKDVSDDFKRKFVSYLKKWPISFFDMNEVIRIHYDSIKKDFDNYANDQRLLASLFGANVLALNDKSKQKPVVDNNNICKNNLRLINAGIEMYSLEAEGTDFSKMSLDEIITLFQKPGVDLLEKGKDYSCPENGKRTIKVDESEGEKVFFVTCDCLKERNFMDDYDSNSKPMQIAKNYRETKFETDRKQMLDYYEMLLKIDHSKPMTKEQMKELSSLENPIYKTNAFHARLGFAYDVFREELEETKKLIYNFIKKYDK